MVILISEIFKPKLVFVRISITHSRGLLKDLTNQDGYCHKFYDFAQEKAREEFIIQKYGLVRFHHRISLETLFNGILQAQQGKAIQLYDLEQLGQEMPFGVDCLNE